MTIAVVVTGILYKGNEDATRSFCRAIAAQYTEFAADTQSDGTPSVLAFVNYKIGLARHEQPSGPWALTHPGLGDAHTALVKFVDAAAGRSDTSDAATASYYAAEFNRECPR
ncbi:hypothetical protein ACFWXB_16290 [Tsukamurella tyrosinosolvens]|uniref:hypothetical protein n=1 Tax=Tsukamurella tyrosinosolvens TaxID=57704 RepID=UPI003687D825